MESFENELKKHVEKTLKAFVHGMYVGVIAGIIAAFVFYMIVVNL